MCGANLFHEDFSVMDRYPATPALTPLGVRLFPFKELLGESAELVLAATLAEGVAGTSFSCLAVMVGLGAEDADKVGGMNPGRSSPTSGRADELIGAEYGTPSLLLKGPIAAAALLRPGMIGAEAKGVTEPVCEDIGVIEALSGSTDPKFLAPN